LIRTCPPGEKGGTPMLIVPSIDLRAGRVVRLRQGDYADQLNYDVDPIETALRFAAAGATIMHLVDLDGAKSGRPEQIDRVAEIVRAAPIPVQVGGGVRTEDDVTRLVDAGVARVVIGTRAVEDLPWLQALLESDGLAGRIVLAVDARDGVIATRGWTATTGVSAVELAGRVSEWPLAGLLYTDVARDGMLTGPNVERTAELVRATRIPVIASGGVGSIEHIRQVKQTGCWGVIVGRSLYEGTVDLPEAIRVAGA
jgi:phosphoribosylformimino-5-aminoimidazole carboxamide ribotide isomerase